MVLRGQKARKQRIERGCCRDPVIKAPDSEEAVLGNLDAVVIFADHLPWHACILGKVAEPIAVEKHQEGARVLYLTNAGERCVRACCRVVTKPVNDGVWKKHVI